MIAGTHVVFSTTLYLGGAALFEYPPSLIGWGLAATAALLPDIDLPTSHFGRILFWISTRLERRFGHRTLTHSLIGLVLVALLALPLYVLVDPLWWWAFVGGYWSHILIDMVNLRGTDLFWPSPLRIVLPGNKNFRIEAGSKAEMILLAALVVISLMLYPVSGLGFRTGLAHLLGNFDMAREQYQKHAGEHWYRLQVTAIDNLSLEKVKGEFPVVGVWRSGLIVLQGDALRAVGNNQDAHNLYPTHVELIAGQPLRVITQRVKLRGRSLGWLLKQIDQQRVYYLSGEVRFGDQRNAPLQQLERYRPAWMSGQVLQLHYARGVDLQPYRNLPAAEGEVFIQFWLKPGDPVVELNLDTTPTEDVIPNILQKFL